MNAEPFLKTVARALADTRLEAVMVGNSAAALHGAPVTTLDIDFMFRETPGNIVKLRAFARLLGAAIFRPFYPVSSLYRVVHENGLQVDFLGKLHGVRSYPSLRSRASTVSFGGYPIFVADLSDIIRSKEAADRPQDRAVTILLRKTLREKEKASKAIIEKAAPSRKRKKRE